MAPISPVAFTAHLYVSYSRLHGAICVSTAFLDSNILATTNVKFGC